MDLDYFAARLIQDALNEATATYWKRRAQALRNARPRPGDFLGSTTPEELRRRWLDLTEAACACDARAAVSLANHGIDEDVRRAAA